MNPDSRNEDEDGGGRSRKDKKTRKISELENLPKTRAQNAKKTLLSCRTTPIIASGTNIKKDEGTERSEEKGFPRKEKGQLLGAIWTLLGLVLEPFLR